MPVRLTLYSYNTGAKMVSYSDEQIKDLITQDFTKQDDQYSGTSY
jgi:hypothetical protein